MRFWFFVGLIVSLATLSLAKGGSAGVDYFNSSLVVISIEDSSS